MGQHAFNLIFRPQIKFSFHAFTVRILGAVKSSLRVSEVS